MEINNIEGIQDYMVTYYKDARDGKHHGSSAKLMYEGYEIKLPPVYYYTIDDAVQGLKDRLAKAIEDFELPTTQSTASPNTATDSDS